MSSIDGLTVVNPISNDLQKNYVTPFLTQQININKPAGVVLKEGNNKVPGAMGQLWVPPAELGTMIQFNGDAYRTVGRRHTESRLISGSWVDCLIETDADNWNQALRQYQADLSRTYTNMMSDHINQAGIYVNEYIVKFIISCFTPEKEASSISALLGTLSNRYAHCINGQTQGTLTAFPVMAQQMGSDTSMSFEQIMGITSNMAAYSILNEFINFKLHLDGSDNGEEATNTGYAMSIIGRANLFGISSFDVPYKWPGADKLQGHFIREIVKGITGNLPSNDQVRQFANANANDTGVFTNKQKKLLPLLKANSNNEITTEIRELINQINNEIVKDKVNALCESYPLIADYLKGGGSYENLIISIAKRVVMPLQMIKWYFDENNNQLLSLVLKAYKEKVGDELKNAIFERMTDDQRKRMLFDAFIDFGLIWKP